MIQPNLQIMDIEGEHHSKGIENIFNIFIKENLPSLQKDDHPHAKRPKNS